MEKTLKSQIPIKILTTANSNGLNKSSVVLIKANQIDTEKLVGLAEKANAKIHALVNYSGASDQPAISDSAESDAPASSADSPSTPASSPTTTPDSTPASAAPATSASSASTSDTPASSAAQ